MVRRRSNILDALQAFNAAYETTSKIGKEMELSKISNAKPEEDSGYTDDQGAQLRAAAASGQYDIAYDQDKGAYTVTPKADPSQVGTIAPGQRTTFMGSTVQGSMAPEQVQSARQAAQAGVLEKYGDIEGANRMRSQQQQMMMQGLQMKDMERRASMEEKRFAREEEAAQREEKYRTGREELLQNSPITRINGANNEAKRNYEERLAAYNEQIKSGKTPQEVGLPPSKPAMQQATPMEILSGYARLIAHDYEYGKLNTEGLIQFQQRMQALEKENYVKALRMAQSGGSPEQVAKAFNESGMQIDPKGVTITRTKQASGPDLVTLNYKEKDGQTTSLPVLAELEAYDKAKEVYDRFYQAKGDKRADRQVGISAAHLKLAQDAGARAAEDHDTAAPVREAQAEVANLRLKLANVDDSTPEGKAEAERIQAKLIAVQSGLRGAGAGHDPADVVKAKKLFADGKYGSEAEALDAVITKPDKMFQEFQKAAAKDAYGNPDRANVVAQKMMEANGWTRNSSGTWRRSGGGSGTGGIESDPRAIAIRDSKALSMDEKRKRLKELGYQ